MTISEQQADRARYVRTVLAWHDHTQADLARILGISQPAANRKLKGLRKFSGDELLAIADHYGIDPGKLLRPPGLEEVLGAPVPSGDFAALPSWPNCEVPWSEALFGRSFEPFAVAGVAA